MPRFLRKFFSIFLFSREKRHRFVNAWGKTRNQGQNNRIIIVHEDGREVALAPKGVVPGLIITFKGNGSLLKLHQPVHFYNSEVLLEDGSTLEIGASAHTVSKASFCIQHGGVLRIGRDFSCMDNFQAAGFDEPGLCVTIGNDCMFSYDVSLRPSDGHTIYDSSVDEVLNAGKNITIGNHVWICMKCILLKGAVIADNCIVGASSVVTGNLSVPNSIYAGIPARRVSKEKPVSWSRRNPAEFQKEKL